MKYVIPNKILSIIILLLNVYFLPITIKIIISSGGPFGFGFFVLPVSLPVNLLIINAFLVFKEKFKNSFILLIFNGLGVVWGLFWYFCFTNRIYFFE